MKNENMPQDLNGVALDFANAVIAQTMGPNYVEDSKGFLFKLRRIIREKLSAILG